MQISAQSAGCCETGSKIILKGVVRMEFGKRINLMLVLMLLFALVISGCGKGKTEEPAATDNAAVKESPAPTAEAVNEPELAPVELTYYYSGTPQKDVGLIEEAMNKILKAKINATIKLNTIDWGSFEQKMNVMSSAGDAYDLVFTAPWMNNYFLNTSKGAFLPLDELLDKYAPTLKATVPQAVWDATRINGKIYGAVNWQIVAMPYGIDVRKDLADKYKLDLNAVKKYEDLEPFFDQVLTNEKGVWPATGVVFTDQPLYYGMDQIGEAASPGWYKIDDASAKAFNQYASPEFKQAVEMAIRWKAEGYIRKDAPPADPTADFKAGKYGTMIGWPVKPGGEFEEKQKNTFDGYPKALSPALITTDRAIATMTAISSTSKNPERAMMFLELINSDKELYNLLCNGIEETHYVFVDKEKGVIGIPEGADPANRGYAPGTDWMFGNQFNGYYTSPDAAGNWEKTIELNKNAEVSPLLGFNFNPDPIKTELAQTGAIVKQYYQALMMGITDISKLDEFLKKLDEAGAEKIIVEKQKQIDEWLKTK